MIYLVHGYFFAPYRPTSYLARCGSEATGSWVHDWVTIRRNEDPLRSCPYRLPSLGSQEVAWVFPVVVMEGCSMGIPQKGGLDEKMMMTMLIGDFCGRLRGRVPESTGAKPGSAVSPQGAFSQKDLNPKSTNDDPGWLLSMKRSPPRLRIAPTRFSPLLIRSV